MHLHFSQHAIVGHIQEFYTNEDAETDMSCQGDTGCLTVSVCWFNTLHVPNHVRVWIPSWRILLRMFIS